MVSLPGRTGVGRLDDTYDCQRQSDEPSLIRVLQSESPKAEKALACKGLAVHGTAQSIPALAPLLSDPELASWARIALEAIPDPAADAALRDAVAKLDDNLLIGVINSIGVRRDPQAVPLLAERLAAENTDVAVAAALSLGRIGDAAAAEALLPQLNSDSAPVRSAAAEGCVRCAEHRLAAGEKQLATQLYDAGAGPTSREHARSKRRAVRSSCVAPTASHCSKNSSWPTTGTSSRSA